MVGPHMHDASGILDPVKLVPLVVLDLDQRNGRRVTPGYQRVLDRATTAPTVSGDGVIATSQILWLS